MDTTQSRGDTVGLEETPLAAASGQAEGEPLQAWEQIAEGRYMPRRIRGSCQGRELG
jgi:hypothetical protein